ncbi:MAG: M28 family peptidase [Candidatus Cloacimonetes bacterium]|nr:M28 family peptidase [Candidatus Cloacimonadota bacterium]
MFIRVFSLFEGVVLLKIVVLLVIAAYLLDGISMPMATGVPYKPGEEFSQVEKRLKTTVSHLASKIGHRNVLNYKELQLSSQFIQSTFTSIGYDVNLERYNVVKRRGYDLYGVKKMKDILEVENVVAIKKGVNSKTLVIGAHYDSVIGSPGADDNATGVAVLLELARLLKPFNLHHTIKFVAFVNEEPPYFQTKEMGSYVSAELSHRRGEDIIGMISLESLGFYSHEKNSQDYPFPLNLIYPTKGNFISFVGNRDSRSLVRDSIYAFRKTNALPSEGASLPSLIKEIGFSDQWSYWQFGYKALMLTDTAHLRNPHYHKDTDTIDKIDYKTMSRLTLGLVEMFKDLASDKGST